MAANLRAMYDAELPIGERLSASMSFTLGVENYTAYLAGMGRLSGMTWEEIARPLQVTRQTAYARYGHGLPADP